MKRKVIVPTTNEENTAIRIYPQKQVELPTYSKQKWGIIAYSLILLFVCIMFLVGTFINDFDWSIFLLLFLPLSYSHNLFNVFAVLEDGLLSGSRFITWKKIKSFHFVSIDQNHKYYGYDKEVNGGYELKIRGKFIPISCIVTSEQMKEKLTQILTKYVEGESVQN